MLSYSVAYNSSNDFTEQENSFSSCSFDKQPQDSGSASWRSSVSSTSSMIDSDPLLNEANLNSLALSLLTPQKNNKFEASWIDAELSHYTRLTPKKSIMNIHDFGCTAPTGPITHDIMIGVLTNRVVCEQCRMDAYTALQTMSVDWAFNLWKKIATMIWDSILPVHLIDASLLDMLLRRGDVIDTYVPEVKYWKTPHRFQSAQDVDLIVQAMQRCSKPLQMADALLTLWSNEFNYISHHNSMASKVFQVCLRSCCGPVAEECFDRMTPYLGELIKHPIGNYNIQEFASRFTRNEHPFQVLMHLVLNNVEQFAQFCCDTYSSYIVKKIFQQLKVEEQCWLINQLSSTKVSAKFLQQPIIAAHQNAMKNKRQHRSPSSLMSFIRINPIGKFVFRHFTRSEKLSAAMKRKLQMV